MSKDVTARLRSTADQRSANKGMMSDSRTRCGHREWFTVYADRWRSCRRLFNTVDIGYFWLRAFEHMALYAGSTSWTTSSNCVYGTGCNCDLLGAGGDREAETRIGDSSDQANFLPHLSEMDETAGGKATGRRPIPRVVENSNHLSASFRSNDTR